MTTGKIIKLISYINLIAEYLRNGVIEIQSNTEYCDDNEFYNKSEREHKIIVDKRKAIHYINADQYDGHDIYVKNTKIGSEINNLSGDSEASAILREEYSPYDSDHKEDPEHKITLCIDGETITIDKNGWR